MPNIPVVSSSSSAATNPNPHTDAIEPLLSPLETQRRRVTRKSHKLEKDKKELMKRLKATKEETFLSELVVGSSSTKKGGVTRAPNGDFIIDIPQEVFDIAEGPLGFDERKVEKARTWTGVITSITSAIWQLKPFAERVHKAKAMRELLLKYANTPQDILPKNAHPIQKMSPITYNPRADIVGTMEHAIKDRTRRLEAIARCLADAQKPNLRRCELVQAFFNEATTTVGVVFPPLSVQYPTLLDYYPYVMVVVGGTWAASVLGTILYKNWLNSKGSTVERLQNTLATSLRGEDLETLRTTIDEVISNIDAAIEESERTDAEGRNMDDNEPGSAELNNTRAALLEVRDRLDPKKIETRALSRAVKEATDVLKPALEALEEKRVSRMRVNVPRDKEKKASILSLDFFRGGRSSATGAGTNRADEDVAIKTLREKPHETLKLTKKPAEANLLRESLPHTLLFLQRKLQKERIKRILYKKNGKKGKKGHPRYRHFVIALGFAKDTIQQITKLQQRTVAEQENTLKVMKSIFIDEIKRV